MQKTNKLEFNVPWYYWLHVILFLGMFGISIFYISSAGNKKDRMEEIGGSIIFFTCGVGGALWPILRKRESKTVRMEFVHSFDMHCEAVVFPMSRVKQLFTIVGGITLSVGIGILLFFTENNENRVKGIIGLAFYICIFVLGLKSLLAGRKGLFLVPNGIIWSEMFRAPCFIPWQSITQTSLFLKKERILTFGLNVVDSESFQTSKLTRKKFIKSKAQHGWYFFFFQETIMYPLKTVAQTVEFYMQHPEARGEIGATNSLARIQKFREMEL